MKAFSKLLLLLVVVLGLALPLLLKGPDGRPIMSLDDWVPNTEKLKEAAESVQQAASEAVSLPDLNDGAPGSVDESPRQQAAAGKMYKWQDENGRWHFSSEPPPDQVQASVEDVPDVENVMQAPVKKEDNSSTISLPSGFSL